MIKNIFKGWYYKIFHKKEGLYKYRMSICNKCPSKFALSKTIVICTECGCELGAKTRVEDEKCMLNKW